MSFLDDLKLTGIQAAACMKDLDAEISRRKVEEWSNQLKKAEKKKKSKNEMPLDIKHSC